MDRRFFGLGFLPIVFLAACTLGNGNAESPDAVSIVKDTPTMQTPGNDIPAAEPAVDPLDQAHRNYAEFLSANSTNELSILPVKEIERRVKESYRAHVGEAALDRDFSIQNFDKFLSFLRETDLTLDERLVKFELKNKLAHKAILAETEPVDPSNSIVSPSSGIRFNPGPSENLTNLAEQLEGMLIIGEEIQSRIAKGAEIYHLQISKIENNDLAFNQFRSDFTASVFEKLELIRVTIIPVPGGPSTPVTSIPTEQEAVMNRIEGSLNKLLGLASFKLAENSGFQNFVAYFNFIPTLAANPSGVFASPKFYLALNAKFVRFVQP
jgi:hypothetical protein